MTRPALPRQRWARRCRIGLGLGILIVLLAYLYLSRVGVPTSLKTRLQAALRAQGLDLNFDRLRLRGLRTLQAEGVNLERAGPDTGPEFYLGEVALQLDLRALGQQRLAFNALDLQYGRFHWTLPSNSNDPLAHLELEDICARLRFHPEGLWELDDFTARCSGTTVRLSGSVSNAPALRTWGVRPTATNRLRTAQLWETQLRRALEVLDRLEFDAPPQFQGQFHGDARYPSRITAQLRGLARNTRSPWGDLSGLEAVTSLNRQSPGHGEFHSTLDLTVDRARTRWADLGPTRLHLAAVAPATNPVPTRIVLEVSAATVHTPWGQLDHAKASASSAPAPTNAATWLTDLIVVADHLRTTAVTAHSNRVNAQLVHSPTNWVPRRASGRLESSALKARSIEVAHLDLGVRARPNAPLPDPHDPALGVWNRLAPWQLEVETDAQTVRARDLDLDRLRGAAQWSLPVLDLTNWVAELGDGRLELPAASLDVRTRQAAASVRLDLHPHQLGGLLPTQAHRWLDRFAWVEPPQARADVQIVVPAWTNAPPDWPSQLLASLSLAGQAQCGAGSYHGVQFTAAHTSVTHTNGVWKFPDLQLARPEGVVTAAYTVNSRTRDYHWQLRAGIDPRALRPLLDPPAQRALDQFTFTDPPSVEGQVRGRWLAPEFTGVHAEVRATNFVFRGERADTFAASVQFTNALLVATQVRVAHGDEWAQADAVGYDVARPWVYLTNAQSRMDPLRVARVIGPKVLKAIAPYRFSDPPLAHVNGHVPARGSTDAADMTFVLAGGPFQYWRFRTPQLASTVHWQGDHVTITNLEAAFYEGKLAGHMSLDFLHTGSADFRFQAAVDSANFHTLVADTAMPTNRLEGRITGLLNVTRANTDDWQSWQGFGQVQMRNGFLWDFPFFLGISQVLNTLSPGLGNSRATAARASYTLTDSVFHTDRLEINAVPVRLQFNGTVDFQGRVHARVVGEVLRGTPILGPLISLAFFPLTKVLEYEVTGTLSQPETEPVYISKVLDSILQPFRRLKNSPAPLPTRPPPPSPSPEPSSATPPGPKSQPRARHP